MEIRKHISKFLTSLFEKNYAQADKSLQSVVEEKLKIKIAKIVEEGQSPAQKAARAKVMEMIAKKKGEKPSSKKSSKRSSKKDDKKKSTKKDSKKPAFLKKKSEKGNK